MFCSVEVRLHRLLDDILRYGTQIYCLLVLLKLTNRSDLQLYSFYIFNTTFCLYY